MPAVEATGLVATRFRRLFPPTPADTLDRLSVLRTGKKNRNSVEDLLLSITSPVEACENQIPRSIPTSWAPILKHGQFPSRPESSSAIPCPVMASSPCRPASAGSVLEPIADSILQSIPSGDQTPYAVWSRARVGGEAMIRDSLFRRLWPLARWTRLQSRRVLGF